MTVCVCIKVAEKLGNSCSQLSYKQSTVHQHFMQCVGNSWLHGDTSCATVFHLLSSE